MTTPAPTESREQYLQKIPAGLVAALELGANLPIQLPADAANPEQKQLRDFLPIQAVPLRVIDPEAPLGRAEELWVLSFFGSVVLGHQRLGEILSMVGEKRAVPTAQRKKMWRTQGLGASVALEIKYERAKGIEGIMAALTGAGYPFYIEGGMLVSELEEVEEGEAKKFVELSDDQLVWLKLEEVMALTNCERVKDVVLPVMNKHQQQRPVLPFRYKNGKRI